MNDDTMRGLAALCKTAATLKVPQGEGVEWISLVNLHAQALVAERDAAIALLREARPDISTWNTRHEECDSCGSRDDNHSPNCIKSRIDAFLKDHP